MNVFKYIFSILYVWVIIYTVSMCMSLVRSRKIIAAVNSLLCIALSLILFVLYVFV